MRQDSHRSSGMTLTSLLIAVAIGSVVSLTLATLVNNIFKLSSRTDALAAADGVMRVANSVITDQTTCPFALRKTSPLNAHVTFTPPNSAPYTYSAAVDRISITRGTQIDQVVISTDPPNSATPPTNVNNRIGENMKLASISLQEVTPGAGRSSTHFGGNSYDVYNAQLVFTFSKISQNTNAGMEGGVLAKRTIPLTVSVNQSTRTVDYCYINELRVRHNDLCTNMNTTFDQATGSCRVTWQPTGDCSGAGCPGPGPGCGVFRWITGFGPTGNAICACQAFCPQGPPPPPLPAPPLPAVTFPSKAKATYPIGSGPSGFGFGT
jgi:hypothetical protein